MKELLCFKTELVNWTNCTSKHKVNCKFFGHESLSEFVSIEIILLPVTAEKNMIFKLMEILATLQKSKKYFQMFLNSSV